MIQKPLNTLVGVVPKLLRNTLAVVSTLFLFSTIIITNMVQMASLIIRPFSLKLFRKVNTLCAGSWWGLCVFFQERLYRIRPVFTGDVIPERENAFLIVNHQGMTDILVLFGLAIRKKRLGNMKYFVKDVLKYVPGMGWGMLFLDCLFLKRNWEQDQDRINRTFGKFKREDIPIWLVSFVEGTRISAAKVEASQRYAQSKGLPEFNNVLLPRTKGFVAVVKNLRDHLDAIYDVTIIYPNGTPSLWQVVQGLVREFHLDVRRFPVDTLPTSDAGLSEWLLMRFREKDGAVEKLTAVKRLRSSP